MAEESAKPPTITTPVGHMRTCEHPCVCVGGAAARSTEGCCENAAATLASAALDMNAAGWQNAAWNQRERWRACGKCWQILMACECAGIDSRMKTIIPHPDVEPAPLSGWFFFFCFHLCAFVFIYCFIIRVCFGCSDSIGIIILFLLFL